MQNRLIAFIFFIALTNIQAQVTQGGLPPTQDPEFASFLAGKMPPAALLPTLDVSNALAEDSHTPGQNRFAAPVTTNCSLENSGTWHTLPNGDRIWLCALRSPGALGLSLIFEEFRLPAGARFFAHGNPGQAPSGAYTAESCTPTGKFLIGVLKGEFAYLELYEPAAAKGQSKLNVNRVDVAYDANALNAPEDFNDALSCHVNINCSTGANWQTQKKGIARILMVFSNGEGWCSGSLVANTGNSFEPYFLTAHHCQILANNPDFSLWRFDFDYESANCANPATEPTPRSVLGCQRIAYRAETDFMLLKLNAIPSYYDVYFNGWNRDNNAAILLPNTVYIHHPLGDIKKISVDTQTVGIFPGTLDWGGAFGVSPANSHWKQVTDIGTFQSGSSGSPLFDANKRIVGQLHGGSTANNQPCKVTGAYFGRFNLSWDQGTTSQSRLKEWLDPNNLGNVTQNGYQRPVVQSFSVSGSVKTHWGLPMKGVRIEIGGGTTSFTYTDTLGNYIFSSVPAGNSYTLKASLDTDDLNGVTTYDLVLTSKHILGVEAFDTPWKMIAADVNQSNSITTFDIVESRKVILGLNTTFPTSSSWRFLPASTVFNNPLNPFSGGLPSDTISIGVLQNNFSGADFKGIKVGDTNNSATGN